MATALPPHLAGPGVSEPQPLKEGCELVEGHSIGSLALPPCPFHPSWGPEAPLLGRGKVKPVGQHAPPHPPTPTESKLGNSVAGTKRVFVGPLSCLGGCSRTTAFLGWTESARSGFSPPLLQRKPPPSHRPCLGTARGIPVLPPGRAQSRGLIQAQEKLVLKQRED